MCLQGGCSPRNHCIAFVQDIRCDQFSNFFTALLKVSTQSENYQKTNEFLTHKECILLCGKEEVTRTSFTLYVRLYRQYSCRSYQFSSINFFLKADTRQVRRNYVRLFRRNRQLAKTKKTAGGNMHEPNNLIPIILQLTVQCLSFCFFLVF